jgi:uncharacterized FlgJ-related protein
VVAAIYIYSNQDINNTTCIYKGLLLFRRQKPDPIAINFNSNEHSVNGYEIVALEKNCSYNSYRETIEKLDENTANIQAPWIKYKNVTFYFP